MPLPNSGHDRLQQLCGPKRDIGDLENGMDVLRTNKKPEIVLLEPITKNTDVSTLGINNLTCACHEVGLHLLEPLIS